jgi:hypothetical protein
MQPSMNIPMFRWKLAIAIVLGTLLGHARAQECSSIQQFDFRNATIPMAASDEGSRSGPATFHLQQGVGFLSDDPIAPQSHDWRIDLLLDRLEHPDPSTWVRVIVLDKDHLTGTGDWRYILAFDCRNGSLASLFQYAAEGVTLKHLSAQTLDLYQAVWAKEDPHCCPSRHMELVYRWNALRHRYVHVSSNSGTGVVQIPDEK